jgi:hypothetical protein
VTNSRTSRPSGILEVGAEPADEAALFLLGAFAVQRDQAFENLFIREIVGPTVGIDDCGVELVVDLFEDGDEALFVDFLILERQLVADDVRRRIVMGSNCVRLVTSAATGFGGVQFL